MASNDTLADEFIKLHSNKGGSCFGDSGGPNLLGNTNVVLAVNSFVANSICSGNTYSYRVDTSDALSWITSTAAAQGGTTS
ncbi:MAG: trypsin-like serine protease [Nocardioides sp.]